MTTDPAPAVFDFETFLKSDDFISRYNSERRITGFYRISGSFSTVASICLIVHILRSHHGLSTTYHRLVFGLAIGDILFSFFSYVLGTIMVPKEYGYIASGAMGNQATCDAQGFLLHFGAATGLIYNKSICIYYLSIVTFNKKDNYIRTKLEPWLHGISILIPLALVSALLAVNGYNSHGISCGATPNSDLPHCMGLESGEIRDGFTIPCGRGDGKVNRFLFMIIGSIVLLTPVVIVVTMALMYRTVHKTEKKMQKYGVGALRLRKNTANNHLEKTTNAGLRGSPPAHPHDDEPVNNSRFSLIQWLKMKATCTKIPCMDREHSNLRPTSTIASQKRAILHRAIGYVTAWGLSWIPWFLLYLLGVNGEAMGYIFAFLNPLQGVFNFTAYMLPKVRNAKKGRPTKRSRVNHGNGNHTNTITWRQAVLKAYMSRGPKKSSGQRHARTNGSSNGSRRSSILATLNTLRTLISSLLRRQPTTKNSNDRMVDINQQQEICPLPPKISGQGKNMASTTDSPPQAKNNGDCGAPTLERNVYESSPPLVLSDDADDLKEEGEGAEEINSEEHHLNDSNGTESMNIEGMGEGLDRVYLSEEVQSILE